MKQVLKGALVAALLAGSVSVGAGSASAAVNFFVGPNGAHVSVGNGVWYDNHHRRHYYAYPSDWQSYHHPMSWYRQHPHWRETNHHDWYRG